MMKAFELKKKRRGVVLALRVLNIALLLGTVAFVGAYVANNWPRIREADFHVDYRFIGLAILLTFLYQCYYAYGWLLSLRFAGVTVAPLSAYGVWGFSQFGKYLPGRVAVLAYRTLILTLQGKASAAQVVLAFGLEAVTSILGGLAAAILSIMIVTATPGAESEFLAGVHVRLDVFGALLFGALVLSGIGLYRPVRVFFFRLLGLEIAIDTVTWWRFLALVLFYLGGWLLLGAILLLTAAGIDGSAISYLQSVLAYSVAGLSGMLSVIAPSGFGVRDGVMTLILSAHLSPAVAFVVSLMARLVATIGDGFSISVGYLIIKMMGLEKLPSDMSSGELTS